MVSTLRLILVLALVGSAASFASATGEQRSGFPVLEVPVVEKAGAVDGEDTPWLVPLVTTGSALLVVLAVFGTLVWLSRRFGSSDGQGGNLPEGVVQNLGSTTIDASTRVTILKCGDRLLLIGRTANGDPQTLSEITDPQEVDRLTNRCLGRPEIVGGRHRAKRPALATG